MAKQKDIKPLRFKDLEEWRNWLKTRHDREDVAWVIFRKLSVAKKKGLEVPYGLNMIRDEALCWGWVDSLLKKLDEEEYMVKFTPRKPTSTWSELNKQRVEALIAQGRMTPAGMRCILVARENGMWDKGIRLPEVDDSLPGALLHAFGKHPEARDGYFRLPQRQQRQYNIWINMAKRAETIQKRVAEALDKLEKGEALGLK